jgi:hypothetical protein
MKKQGYWINCTSVTAGMTAGEYSVELKTADGQGVSLFAPQDFVDQKNGWLRVSVIEQSGSRSLVYLPATPFEVGSRFIAVNSRDVKK